MAIERNVSRNDNVFTGEDKSLVFTIYQADGVTPQNLSGWALSWFLKRNKADTDAAAKISKSIGSGIVVSGTYDAIPANNTQRVTVTLTDDETALILSTITYYHELKRTDANVETVLSHGTFAVRQAVHR